jgi:hypothetical protein
MRKLKQNDELKIASNHRKFLLNCIVVAKSQIKRLMLH